MILILQTREELLVISFFSNLPRYATGLHEIYFITSRLTVSSLGSLS